MRSRNSFVQRIIKWRFLSIVNVLLILFLSIALGREIVRSQDIQKDIDALQAEADELATKNLAMKEFRTAMQTESFIEREARLKLGMKKPGEKVVIVKEAQEIDETEEVVENPDDPLGLVIDSESAPQLANTTKWWYYFFNKPAFDELQSYEN